MSKYGIPCCGKCHDTPYCPLCGRQLVEKHELGDLLRHCETTLRNLKDAYAIRVSRGRPCEKKENVIARWQRWVNGLRRLIEEQDAGLLVRSSAFTPVIQSGLLYDSEAVEKEPAAPEDSRTRIDAKLQTDFARRTSPAGRH